VNQGIFTTFGQQPAMPYGLLGMPTPIPISNARLGLSVASIPSLACWFDAAESSTITATGGFVSEWKSKVGGFTSTQSAGNQPKFVASAINGRPALSFDGSTSKLTTTYPASTLKGFVTYAAAVRLSATPSNQVYWPIICARYNGYASALLINTNTTPQRWTVCHQYYLYDSVAGGAIALAPQRIVAGFDATGLRVRVNGTYGRDYSSPPPNSLNQSTFIIGQDTYSNNRFFAGFIGEILVWSRFLTETEMANVDEYLASKWAI
jgi:Concanavalin A-like lectin/glucanases superfamily